jgi:DNA repair protein RecO (recombination protein O)
MSNHYRTLGLIIKKENLREADQSFVVYSENLGKIKIIGRAIRKINAKLKGSFQLFNLVDLEFVQGKNQKTLINASIVGNFTEIRKDLKKMKTACQIAEISDSFIRKEEKDDKLWKLLNETFFILNKSNFSLNKLLLFYYYYFWNLVAVLGYEPQLYDCVLCRRKLNPGKLYFSSESGGIICHPCLNSKKNDELVLISIETVKILRLILKNEWQIISKLKIGKSSLTGLKEVSNLFFNFLLN